MEKYSPLKSYLLTQKGSHLLFSFKQIEKIICDKLPPSAYYLRQWWENSKSPGRKHVQAVAWTSAGWEVDEVYFKSQQVSFRKVT